MFEGQLVDSVWTGFGRKYFDRDGDKIVSYEGQCLDNVPHGFGRFYHPQTGALWYEGHFARGKFEGWGRLTDAAEPLGTGETTLYEGQWSNGLKHGFGAFHYDSEYIFEGRWRRDRKVEGTVTYLNERSRQVFFPERELTGGDKAHFYQKRFSEKWEGSDDELGREERKSVEIV
jgi:hypothetical protein